MTVVPQETWTKRLYSLAAIAWSLALFGCQLLPPAQVRKQVSPWAVVGAASEGRWVTLWRWAAAIEEGRLFHCVRTPPDGWSVRQVAQHAAVTLSTYAPHSPEPPPVAVLAFQGAARAW